MQTGTSRLIRHPQQKQQQQQQQRCPVGCLAADANAVTVTAAAAQCLP